MTSWTDAGFDLDPEGDAARRAEFASASTGSPPPLLVPRDRPLGVDPLSVPEEHEVTTGERDGIGYALCACGQWEAAVTGAASARWALTQYREHLRLVGLG